MEDRDENRKMVSEPAEAAAEGVIDIVLDGVFTVADASGDIVGAAVSGIFDGI
jgi:hypothetical protein